MTSTSRGEIGSLTRTWWRGLVKAVVFLRVVAEAQRTRDDPDEVLSQTVKDAGTVERVRHVIFPVLEVADIFCNMSAVRVKNSASQ